MPQAPTSIILPTHEFAPKKGGIATYIEEVAQAAQELGLHPQVWSASYPHSSPDNYDFPVRRLPLAGNHNWPTLYRSARLLAQAQDTLRHSTLHLAEPGPLLACAWLHWRNKLSCQRLLITLHGSEILKFAQHKLYRPLTQALFQQADRILFLSRYTQELFQQHFPQVAQHTTLSIVPGAPRRPLGKQDYPLPTLRPHRILCVGRIHPRKGQIQLLQALHTLPQTLTQDWSLLLVGPIVKPRYAQQLRALIHQSAIDTHILDDVSDAQLPSLYQQSHLFAMTSLPHQNSVEGLGLTYLEASTHGLPLLAHDIGGVADAVLHQQTGLLAQPDQPQDLSQKLEQLLRHPELRQQLGQQGQKFTQSLSWQKHAQSIYQQ